MKNKIKRLWGRMLNNFFFLLLPLVQPCWCRKVCRGCLASHWCNLFALQLCVAGSHCNLNESLQLVSARDLRPLWSRVLQHHHHHLRQAFASRFGFLSNTSEKNQRQNFLFENTRELQKKKRNLDLDQLQSRSIFSSLLFSSSFFSSVLLLLFFRLQQRSVPPPGHAPPVLGTREWPCPHRPC